MIYKVYFSIKLDLLGKHDTLLTNGLGNSFIKLGQLYDWPTRQFDGGVLFIIQLPELTDIIESHPLRGNDIDNVYYADSSFDLKFELFGIQKRDMKVDTKLSLLSSTFPVYGSFEFFRHRITNKKTIMRFWTFTKNTEYFGIKIDKEVRPYLINYTLLNTDATYVVVGIEYGMRAVIGLEMKEMVPDNYTDYWGKYLEDILYKIREEILDDRTGLIITGYNHLESLIKFYYYSDFTYAYGMDEPKKFG